MWGILPSTPHARCHLQKDYVGWEEATKLWQGWQEKILQPRLQGPWLLYPFARAAITKNHRLSGLNNRSLLSQSWGLEV